MGFHILNNDTKVKTHTVLPSKQVFARLFASFVHEVKNIRLKNICEQDPKHNDMDYSITPEKLYITDHTYALSLDSNASSGNNCPICHALCKDEEELSVFNERSIKFDICYAWFHFGCLKMTPKKLEEIGESSWYCSLCYHLQIIFMGKNILHSLHSSQMVDGCLECDSNMCLWLAFSCREESVTTYIESVQKGQQCQTLNANNFLQKQLETCFFNPLVFSCSVHWL